MLIFGVKNINLELKYQFLDQINLFEFKLKIMYSNQEIQIMVSIIDFFTFQIKTIEIQISIFKFESKIQSSNINFEIHYMNNIHTYACYICI
jgi:hypothetical protein